MQEAQLEYGYAFGSQLDQIDICTQEPEFCAKVFFSFKIGGVSLGAVSHKYCYRFTLFRLPVKKVCWSQWSSRFFRFLFGFNLWFVQEFAGFLPSSCPWRDFHFGFGLNLLELGNFSAFARAHRWADRGFVWTDQTWEVYLLIWFASSFRVPYPCTCSERSRNGDAMKATGLARKQQYSKKPFFRSLGRDWDGLRVARVPLQVAGETGTSMKTQLGVRVRQGKMTEAISG